MARLICFLITAACPVSDTFPLTRVPLVLLLTAHGRSPIAILSSRLVLNITGSLSWGCLTGYLSIITSLFSRSQSYLRTMCTVNMRNNSLAYSLPTQDLAPPPKGIWLYGRSELFRSVSHLSGLNDERSSAYNGDTS